MKHIMGYAEFVSESESNLSYRPLQRLLEARRTLDGRHLLLDGVTYCCETGAVVPFNESWSWSDILHAGADALSMVMDAVGGSGAVVDVLNRISYIIEAQFVDESKRSSLYLMSAITFAFVYLPGPLQLVSIPLKNFVKSGAKAASPIIKNALKTLAGIMPSVLKGVPNLINNALKSPLAKTLLGKWAGRVAKSIKAWSEGVAIAFKKIMGEQVAKAGVKASLKEVLSSTAVQSLKKAFTLKSLKMSPKVGEKALRKLGYVAGKPYRYINKQGKSVTAKIVGSSVDGSSLLVKFGNKAHLSPTTVPIDTWIRQATGAPWGRRGYTVAAPFAVKQFARMVTDDGDIDPNAIETVPPLDPELVSKESMAYFEDEVPDYDGAGEGI